MNISFLVAATHRIGINKFACADFAVLDGNCQSVFSSSSSALNQFAAR